MRNILLFITALLSSSALLAQTESAVEKLKDYATNIINFNREHPQEKVYLHMDNRSYYLGDTIWFKAYVLNATTLRPTETSGVLYVELLNEHGVEMAHRKLRVENGMCHGEFPLEESYRTGYYEIRAYTRNMLNFGNEEKWTILAGGLVLEAMRFTNYNEMAAKIEHPMLTEKDSLRMRSSIIPPRNHTIFSRVFPVYMKPQAKGEYKREKKWYPPHTSLSFPQETNPTLRPDNLHISFYPEGGALIEGINSIVAFEATDQWGRKCDVKGRIANNKETITTFSTTMRGRGTFRLLPESEEQYTAFVTYKGKDYKFKLPIPKKQGYTLHVTPPIGKGKTTFTVKGNVGDEELLGLILQCRGAAYAYDTLRVASNDSASIQIDYRALRPGVNQLTLFDTSGKALADRLFFVNPHMPPATLDIQHIPDSLLSYQKVSLDMSLRDNSQMLFATGFFSLSVTDAADSITTYDTRDIRSELLLCSDLKGFIEDADSYFHHHNDTLMASDLDLLMLVQGWRRYEWETMSGRKPYSRRYAPEKGLMIDGYVISNQVPNGKSIFFADDYPRIPSLKMDVSLRGEYIRLRRTIEADSLGNFSLDLNTLTYDQANMHIHLQPTDLSQEAIRKHKLSMRHSYAVINRVFSPATTPYSYYQYHMPNEELAVVADTGYWAMDEDLDEVTIQKRRKRTSVIHYEHPEIVIDFYREWNNIIDRGIPGVFTSPEGAMRNIMSIDYSMRRANLFSAYVKSDSVNRRQGGAYILPDTIKVYSNVISRDSILQLDPQTEKRRHSYCVVGYKSRSKSPQYPPFQSRNNTRHTYFEGYNRVAEFYSPDYSDYVLPDSVDYRRTLYWDPDVRTDQHGRASISFYNSKRAKHLHVRAEGFTRYGEFIVYDSDKE